MRRPLRVLVLGTGQMGSGIIRLVLEKDGLDLVGAYARRPERAGMDVGRSGRVSTGALDLAVDADLPALIERTRPDVAIQATCSRLSDAVAELTALLERGVNVISIAEEMAWPAARSPERAGRIDELARAHGVSVLGTGVNPGFVLDLLVIALTAVCSHVETIQATRTNDLAPYGPSVLRTQGVGLTPEGFAQGLADGSVVGHFGFPESIGMIAASLGWEIERIDETREPIVSRVRRETPFVTVEPGCTAGCLHRAVAWRGGRPVIALIHPQQVHPHLEGVDTGDAIEISGTPDVRLAGSPEIPGGVRHHGAGGERHPPRPGGAARAARHGRSARARGYAGRREEARRSGPRRPLNARPKAAQRGAAERRSGEQGRRPRSEAQPSGDRASKAEGRAARRSQAKSKGSDGGARRRRAPGWSSTASSSSRASGRRGSRKTRSAFPSR